MVEEYLLGIDIGTSSCKIALFDSTGNLVDYDQELYDVDYPAPGWAEQNPDDWWNAVAKSTKRIMDRQKVNPKAIKGVGVDGQSWSCIPVDEIGNVLSSTPIWLDTRSKEICERIEEEIGSEKIFQTSGNSFSPTYSLPKMLWFKENRPDIYKKTFKFLQSNSFIVYRLTNRFSQDISQAYGFQCFNMRTGEYDSELAQELGIDLDLLPNISACHEIIGTVTAESSRLTGIPVGTPVVAGGLDAACGALGVGVINDGETQEQGGQAGGMSICISEYKADPRLILSYHVVPGKWLLQGGTVGGAGVAKWFLNNFGKEEILEATKNDTNPFTEMDIIAKKIKPGSDGLIFLPYMAGERSPIWNPKAKGVYYGIDFSKSRAHFIRSYEEGGAFALKHNLDVAEQLGVTIKELRSMGGAANSLLWTQIKADVTGKKIVVPNSDTATTLGAAILAGVGVGVYSSFDEATRTINVERVHEPNVNNSFVYKKQYKKYLKLYERLQPLMDEDNL